jgi:hypothetical protein
MSVDTKERAALRQAQGERINFDLTSPFTICGKSATVHPRFCHIAHFDLVHRNILGKTLIDR